MKNSSKSLIEDITIGELLTDKHGRTRHEKGFFQPNQKLAFLRKDLVVSDWLAGYPPGTQTSYSCYFNMLLERLGKTPKEMKAMNSKELKRNTLKVMGELVLEGKHNSAKNVMNAAKSFADKYEKEIRFSYSERIRVGRIKNEIVPRPHQIYAIAELASARSHPINPRNKALILLTWMTSLRKNAVRNLRCGALMGYSESDCPIPIKVGNEFQKIGQGETWCIDDKLAGYGVDFFYTFLDIEGFNAVQDWLRWRKANIGDYQKTDYLFCTVQEANMGGRTKIGNPMSPIKIWETYKEAAEKIGMDRTSTTFHKLRDAFKSVMIRADVDGEVREVLMGHAPKGSQKNYFDYNDIDMARKEYMKADWTRAQVHKIDKLEKENAELATAVAKLNVAVMSIKESAMQNSQLGIWETIAKLQNEVTRLQGINTATLPSKQNKKL